MRRASLLALSSLHNGSVVNILNKMCEFHGLDLKVAWRQRGGKGRDRTGSVVWFHACLYTPLVISLWAHLSTPLPSRYRHDRLSCTTPNPSHNRGSWCWKENEPLGDIHTSLSTKLNLHPKTQYNARQTRRNLFGHSEREIELRQICISGLLLQTFHTPSTIVESWYQSLDMVEQVHLDQDSICTFSTTPI